MEGFSGVGGGGFGRVGKFGGGFGGQGFGFTGGAGAQQAGGYIGLLQTAQIIRNQYSNIAALGDSVEQLQAAYDAGRIDRFQVDLARQALYNAQSQLLNSRGGLRRYALDNFKLQHGLPPEPHDQGRGSDAGPFQLLDPDLAAVQIRVTDVLTVLREGSQAAALRRAGDEPLTLPTAPPPQPETEAVATDFATLVAERPRAERNRARASRGRPERFAPTRGSTAQAARVARAAWPNAKMPARPRSIPTC